jgi:hypothetical protein
VLRFIKRLPLLEIAAVLVTIALAGSVLAQGVAVPDGVPMTFEQFKAMRIEQMQRMSARVNERLTRPDLTPEQQQRLTQTKTRLQRLQSLSPDQVDARLHRTFDAIDTAHTGTITLAQMRAFQQQQRQSHQHPGGAGGQDGDDDLFAPR